MRNIHTMRQLLSVLWFCLFLGGASAQQRAVPLDAERPWLAAADSLSAAGYIQEALAAYRELSQEHRSDSGVWIRIALVELQLNRAGLALEAARSAAAVAPANDPSVAIVLSQCQAAAGNPSEGIATLEAALTAHPEDTDLLETVATVSIATAEWAKAAGTLRQLVRLRPQRMVYRYDLARILLNQNDFDGTDLVAHEALEVGGDPALCYAILGKSALMRGDLETARGLFLISIDNGDHPEAHGGMGALSFIQGRPAEAVGHFRKALELSPTDPDLYFNLGNALAQIDRVEEAERAYRNSLRYDPNSPDTLQNLGVLLLARVRPLEAQAAFERAVELAPESPGAYLYLARTRAALFDFEAAIRFYRAYQLRAVEEEEKARIEEVIADLEIRVGETKAARSRGEVHLLQIKVGTREGAARILDRVRNGEDFYSLAHQFSELMEVTGVDAGFVDPNSMNELFAGAVATLEPQECTPVLEAPSGFFLFQRVQ